MNRMLLAVAFAALLVSNALGVRVEFGSGHQSAANAQPASPGAYQVAAATAPTPAAPSAAPPPAAAPQLSPQQTYMQDQAAVQRINAQIDAMLAQPNGGFAVTYYAKPLPPPRERDGRDGRGGEAQQQPQQKELQPGEVKRDRYGNAEKYVIARAGDTVYATLDRAFNSDDPGAPIFATIHDVDEVGIQGPLDGVRMIGTIHYSTSQGAIQFEKGYLPDGRPLEVKGLAISEDTARTGIAKNVDNHELQRYGTLLFATLVQGRWCILTPPPQADPAAVERVAEFWRRLGAEVETMDAAHHDRVLAVTSHLPHLIAYTIVGTASDMEEVTAGEVIKYSAGGFRDFTRIAASDPTMWRDVFLANKDAVLEMLQRFSEDLTALQRAIRWGDGDALFDLFTRTRAVRRSIVEQGQDDARPDFGRAHD